MEISLAISFADFFRNLFIHLFPVVLSLCCCVRALSSCSEQGLSRCRAQAVGHSGFGSCSVGALELALSSRGTWAKLLLGLWDLPGLGV